MQDFKKEMIESALEKHKKIYPCAHHVEFDDCFTIADNHLLFWFNTEDNSTRLISKKINLEVARSE